MILCDNGCSSGYFGFSAFWSGDAKTASAPEEYKGLFPVKPELCPKFIGYIE